MSLDQLAKLAMHPITREVIERIEVVYNDADRRAVIAATHGWHVTTSGPHKSNAPGRYDIQFLIAERPAAGVGVDVSQSFPAHPPMGDNPK